MGLRGGEAPKIVQIETRYVQTDAVNFRDVVQSLTGKNSSTDWIGQNAASSSGTIQGGIAKPQGLVGAAVFNGTKETLLPSSMQMNNVSLKDFDGFMLPPMEMMPWSYS
ncbi:Modulating plastid sigma factor [Spatholobus suberectus]|nr:Modulating plastid sigma factor [Spatholobus suberectus]TKY71969.1 Modulating plastid sigma factor [Spatholobus suberectus]